MQKEWILFVHLNITLQVELSVLSVVETKLEFALFLPKKATIINLSTQHNTIQYKYNHNMKIFLNKELYQLCFTSLKLSAFVE
jgi:hypothetical protein